jgi:glycosyltransferase involved in cell wall biosynthesis
MIALFDYIVTSNNAIGKCNLLILESLCWEHEFTVFAVRFENPCPSRIRWVRIPSPTRPQALLFVMYHFLAPIFYWYYQIRNGCRFSLIQLSGCNLAFGHLTYAHFCNRAYLKYHWKQSRPRGARGLATWTAHWLHALVEPIVFRRARLIVAASKGLAVELSNEYPNVKNRIRILPNSINLTHMKPPPDFDRELFRKGLGLGENDLAIVFVGLGHFERKGLPQLLEALKIANRSGLKLTVVGGMPDLISAYRQRTQQIGLSESVRFVGMQADVRPYLWSADLFALPSFYEVFPLVALEAAAAGLPLLVTRVSGVEEFMVDEQGGLVVERNREDVARGIIRFASLTPETREGMGREARRSVEQFSPESFATHWREMYSSEWTQ